MQLEEQIEGAIGIRPKRINALSGGMIGQVYRVDLTDGETVVAKVAKGNDATLDIEGYMLRYLSEHSNLPVPDVLHSTKNLLVMTFIEGSSNLPASVQTHAAELLADLHSVHASQFGLERDTLIGSLHQPNPQTTSWIAFFRDQRLLYMGRAAVKEGRMPSSLLSRLEKFCGNLDKWIVEPEHPSLIHGDMWTTNILASNGRITGFVDPAIYYAHPEIELAFSTLFGTYGEAFFRRYNEIRPLETGFMDPRRDIYNLYPLLVHVRIFGGSYVRSVETILQRIGF